MQTYYQLLNKKEVLKPILWLMCLFLVFTSCQKDDLTGNLAGFYYEETYCADPWAHDGSSSDAALQTLVSDYLSNSLGVKFYRLRITDDGTPELCLACTCKTGRIIRIEADLAYEQILKEEGFKKE